LNLRVHKLTSLRAFHLLLHVPHALLILGLLGFGSPTDDSYHAEFAGSAAILINRGLAIGGEYRTMPRDLKTVGHSGNYSDIFIAYFPCKHVSITGAYAFLGDIAPAVDAPGKSTRNQNAFYISAQLAF